MYVNLYISDYQSAKFEKKICFSYKETFEILYLFSKLFLAFKYRYTTTHTHIHTKLASA